MIDDLLISNDQSYPSKFVIDFHINNKQMQQLNLQIIQSSENFSRLLIYNPEKIQLMTNTINRFTRLTFISLLITAIRIVFSLKVYCLTCTDPFRPIQQIWNAMFVIFASGMDGIIFAQELMILKNLKEEQPAFNKIKQELASNSANISSTRLGSYTVCLSIYSMISAFKSSLNGISSMNLIKYAEAVIIFFFFGNFALDSHKYLDTPLYNQALFWIYILYIYVGVFELDFIFMQTSQGAYVEAGELGVEGKELDQIKENYLTQIRLPFEAIYILNVLLIFQLLLSLYQPSLFVLTLAVSALLQTSELIYEKCLQRRLTAMDFNSFGKKEVTPYLILWELTKESKRLHLFLCSSNRVMMVVTLMGYFRSVPLEMAQTFLFFLIVLLFFLAQTLKFNLTSKGKLYTLKPTINLSSSQRIDCLICLMVCEKGRKVVQLPCFSKHIYHYQCMSIWLQQKKECPVCRYSLERYVLQY